MLILLKDFRPNTDCGKWSCNLRARSTINLVIIVTNTNMCDSRRFPWNNEVDVVETLGPTSRHFTKLGNIMFQQQCCDPKKLSASPCLLLESIHLQGVAQVPLYFDTTLDLPEVPVGDTVNDTSPRRGQNYNTLCDDYSVKLSEWDVNRTSGSSLLNMTSTTTASTTTSTTTYGATDHNEFHLTKLNGICSIFLLHNLIKYKVLRIITRYRDVTFSIKPHVKRWKWLGQLFQLNTQKKKKKNIADLHKTLSKGFWTQLYMEKEKSNFLVTH